MKKKVVFGVIVGVLVLSLAAAFFSDGPADDRAKTGEKIGLIYVEGTITGSKGSSLLGGGAGAPDIMEQLKKAREDGSVKAVLIRINSPGGSAAASQEIGEEIEKVRQAGKPVVASMGETAASGGYWIAAKADKIMADPSTMTGSIGVIMQTMNMQELFNNIGISPQTLKSGQFKDIGSSYRPMTDEERKLLQQMVDDIFQQFVDVVAEGRKMSREQVLALADGRIFTGRQAKELGLVDELGNFYDAVDWTAELAGIEGEPQLVELGKKNPFDQLFAQLKAFLGLHPLMTGLSGEAAPYLEVLKARQLWEVR